MRQRIGGAVSLLLGLLYLVMLSKRLWGHEVAAFDQPLVVISFLATALLACALVSIAFRPSRVWSYPWLFSAPSFFLALAFLWEWQGLLLFAAVGATTLVAGAVGSQIARLVVAFMDSRP